ncbi:MAG TPA: A/G-specific adenine glycosylase [Gemmataceae bacterium]|nr:A/G-specific adenine glycosylase [Gemmataceae bacterium]
MEFAQLPGPPQDAGRPSPSLRRRVRHRVLSWFETARRDLPWRRNRDPYRIWVSEVMLQQTTVAAVVPYFERFLHAFPTLRDLAAAPEQDVLRLWEGLGYYRRARDLHRAARQLAAAHDGTIPDDPDILRQLPGLGRYTLGAVLSQAFDRRLPALEANSLRVLCRLFGRSDDPRRGPAQHWLWQTAEELLPDKRVGDFNQALMELGALVCTPAAPRCDDCPLAPDCVARRLGLQAEIPARAPPPAITEVREAAVVIRRGTDVLLVQRPESANRWANLWEFPHGPVADGESHEEAAVRLGREAGLEVAIGPELLTLRHGVTRFRISMVCFEAEADDGEFRSDFYRQGLWVPPERLPDYPVSAPQRRLAKALLAKHRQRTLF